MAHIKESKQKPQSLPCVAKAHITEVWNLFEKLKKEGKIQHFMLDTLTGLLNIRKRFLVTICGRKICYTFSPAREARLGNHFESTNARYVNIALSGESELGLFLKDIENDVLIKWTGFTLEDNVEDAFSAERRPKWCTKFEKAPEKLAATQGINFIIKVMHPAFGIYETYDINVRKISVGKEREEMIAEKYSLQYPHVIMVPLELTSVPQQIHQIVLSVIKSNRSKKSRLNI